MANTIFCFFLYQRLIAVGTGRILTEIFLNDRLFIENAREHTARLELLAFNSSTSAGSEFAESVIRGIVKVALVHLRTECTSWPLIWSASAGSY